MHHLLILAACVAATTIIAAPPLITYRLRAKLLRVLGISVPICMVLGSVLAYFPDASKYLEISSFATLGFNPDGLNREERVLNLAPDHHEAAEAAYWSNMGVGYPVRALFAASASALYALVSSLSINYVLLARGALRSSNSRPVARVRRLPHDA
jgi:hypothetical protein